MYIIEKFDISNIEKLIFEIFSTIKNINFIRMYVGRAIIFAKSVLTKEISIEMELRIISISIIGSINIFESNASVDIFLN